ncbi:MAG: RnfABCDGE type electron transport complex subunit D, partial [Gammaproteobacteria bacterium]|nr:RnfABCDGE type electron transport complex subunit D [Gammaproteobacteria bacterium]
MMQAIDLRTPHIHLDSSVSLAMRRVLYALVPALAVQTWFFSWGVLINVLYAGLAAVVFEALMLRLRGRPAGSYLADGSAVLTGVLLAMALPPLSPWWMTLIGVGFAVVVGKHLYGGLGYNPFNPAMLGYVLLLTCFPLEMTSWVAPRALVDMHIGFSDAFTAIFLGTVHGGISVDAITMASPLDSLKVQLGLARTVQEILEQPTFGNLGGRGWEFVDLALLAGGLWLIWKRVIGWHIPVAMLGTLALLAMIFNLVDPGRYATPMFHVFSGAAMLGAFYIATDPVSASTTPRGRLIF